MPSLTQIPPELLMGLSPEELEERAQEIDDLRIKEAREFADCFTEYAIPHEKTGKPITNGEIHQDWHEHLDRHDWGIIFSPVEHGKTQQIAIGRTIWALGRDPNLRIALISNTARQAEKLLSSISQLIQGSDQIKKVFPHMKPSTKPGTRWNQSEITVERPTFAKDPSISTFGAGGPIVGSRFDIILVDDVLDFENTRTPDQLRKLRDWYETIVFTRLFDEEEGHKAKLWMIGTPWHQEDLMHHLADMPNYHVLRMSAVRNPAASMKDWVPTWPEQWTRDRLISRHDGMSPHNFARKFLCDVRDDRHARFQRAWISGCLDQGKNWALMESPPRAGGVTPARCYTGVDLGVGQKDGADLSCIFTFALDQRGRRQVVDIQSGRWSGPEIVARIQDVYRRYDSVIGVETNGAQDFMRQWVQGRGVPVHSFKTTGASKWDEAFGIESMAIEMRSRMWVIPSRGGIDTEVREWIREMLYYTPEAHTGDRLMASWIAREMSRRHSQPMVQSSKHMAR